MTRILAALLFLALASCAGEPAYAQSCQSPKDVEKVMAASGVPVVYLEPQFIAPFVARAEQALGISLHVQVTGVLIAGGLRFGFVSGQCISDPLPMEPLQKVQQLPRLSGLVNGRYYA